MTIHPYDFIFTGLALDILGAVVLAKGFMFKETKAAYYESRSIYGGNLHILKSALIQRAEAQVGAIFLITGFVLQIWGNLHGGIATIEPGWINSIPRMVLVMLGTSFIAYSCLKIMRRRAKDAFYRIFFNDKSRIQDSDSAALDQFALLFDLKRKSNESDSSLRARLETLQNELGVKYNDKKN